MLFLLLACRALLLQLTEPVIKLPAENLLVFHSCDPRQKDCYDPMLHELKMAYSEDGDRWKLWEALPPLAGSVPDLLIRDSILYIYALPELHRLDLFSGEWLPSTRVHVFDQRGNRIIHVDPSPVLTPNNDIVLFFLRGIPGIDPATCAANEGPCTKEFLSATEISGSEGTRFRLDAGKRASVSLRGPGDFASDPDVFKNPSGYVMYISRGQGTDVYHAKELQGSYQFLSVLTSTGGGVPAGYYDQETRAYWSFTSKHVAQPWIQELRLEKHSSLDIPPSFSQSIIAASSEAPLMQASPGFWKVEP
jgi:hypothetical protein